MVRGGFRCFGARSSSGLAECQLSCCPGWPRVSPNDVAGATLHVYPEEFKWPTKKLPPFPSDPHYDAKAWEVCLLRRDRGSVLFWNVTGPAQP